MSLYRGVDVLCNEWQNASRRNTVIAQWLSDAVRSDAVRCGPMQSGELWPMSGVEQCGVQKQNGKWF